MIVDVKIDKIFFFDVESATSVDDYNKLSPALQDMWVDTITKKYPEKAEKMSPEESYLDMGALFPEFARVVCISYAYFWENKLRMKSLTNTDEAKLLSEFIEDLKYFEANNYTLLAHNNRNFDCPFLCKRIILNRMKLPYILNVVGKKPWEIKMLDTMELWRMGSYKGNTASLDLLCASFNIPSPKEGITGADVGRVFYGTLEVEGDPLQTIALYCCRDVVALARVFQCMNGLDPVLDDDIIYNEKAANEAVEKSLIPEPNNA